MANHRQRLARSSIRRTAIVAILGLILLGALAISVLHLAVLPRVDAANNANLATVSRAVSDGARRVHAEAFVADLHADALLWGRDLRQRHARGHVDLPRLIDGGVDLQVFGVVTKVPRARSYSATPGDSDVLPLLFVATLRSPATWFSPRRRALAQAAELRRLAATSALSLVLRRADLDGEGPLGLLALEGMHALEGEAAALDELHAAGFRMMGLAHFFDNEIAGSAHGVDKHGLTALGRRLLPRMEALGITVDLAHASPAAFADTLALVTRPVVVSHGGVQGTCPGPRNLSDAQLRAVAANGGVVGIGYWKAAVCDPGLDGIVNAIRHVIAIAGVDHVGLGSDFDGYVRTPFDVAGLPMLTAALLDAGLSAQDTARVLGGNVRRVLAANLPG